MKNLEVEKVPGGVDMPSLEKSLENVDLACLDTSPVGVGLGCLEKSSAFPTGSKLRFSAPSMEFVWETDPEGKKNSLVINIGSFYVKNLDLCK